MCPNETQATIITAQPYSLLKTKLTVEYVIGSTKYKLTDDFLGQSEILQPGTKISICYNTEKPEISRLRTKKFIPKILLFPFLSIPLLPLFVGRLIQLLIEPKNKRI